MEDQVIVDEQVVDLATWLEQKRRDEKAMLAEFLHEVDSSSLMRCATSSDTFHAGSRCVSSGSVSPQASAASARYE